METITRPMFCPYCGNIFHVTLHTEIIIPGEEALKKKILNKTMHFPKCPSCRNELKIKGNCLYINETRGELYALAEDENETIENLMKVGDSHSFLKGYLKRRLVYNVDAFREKILLSDYNYDDRIVELMKLELSKGIEKENHKPVYRIFVDDVSGNGIRITAIMGAKAPFEYITIKTPASTYTQFSRQYLERLKKPEDDEYVETDQDWAKRSGILDHERKQVLIET